MAMSGSGMAMSGSVGERPYMYVVCSLHIAMQVLVLKFLRSSVYFCFHIIVLQYQVFLLLLYFLDSKMQTYAQLSEAKEVLAITFCQSPSFDYHTFRDGKPARPTFSGYNHSFLHLRGREFHFFEWSCIFSIRSINVIQSLCTLSLFADFFFVYFVLETHIFQEGIQFSMTVSRCFSRIFNDNDVFVDNLVLARRGFVSHQ